MRILLDENVPEAVRHQIQGRDVRTVQDMGRAGVTNGKLIEAAEQTDFDALETGDKNPTRQNNLTGRRLAILELATTHWPTIRANPEPLQAAIDRSREGSYAFVAYPRLPLRRRPGPAPP